MLGKIVTWDYVAKRVKEEIGTREIVILAHRIAQYCQEFHLPNPDVVYSFGPKQILASVRSRPNPDLSRTVLMFTPQKLILRRVYSAHGTRAMKTHDVQSGVFVVYAQHLRIYLGHPEHG